MAKRTSTTYLTPGEQVAGAVLFVIYLLVLPFATGPLFRLVEALLGTSSLRHWRISFITTSCLR